MNISVKSLGTKMLLGNFKRGFATSSVGDLLSKRIEENKVKSAVRFENQGRTWTYHELNEHSNAFAYGLVELGYKPGDRLVFWFDKTQTSQVANAQLGAAKVGVSIVPIEAKDAGELENILKDTESRGLLVSPNGKIGNDKKYIDVVNDAIPSLAKAYNGQPLKHDKLPKLKHIIHTGFYSYPGTLKYRHILVYGNPNFLASGLPKTSDSSALFYVKKGSNYQSITHGNLQQKVDEFRKQNSIDQNHTILVVGNTNTPSAFAYGLYNSLAHQNFVILSGAEPLKDVLTKQHMQRSNFIFLNDDKLSLDDAQGALDEAGVEALKKVFVSSSASDVAGLSGIFGQKTVQKFDPLLA